MNIHDPESRPPRWVRSLAARGVLLVAGVLLISVLAGFSGRAAATDEAVPPSLSSMAETMRALQQRAEAAEGEAAVLRVQNHRHSAIYQYSARYHIPADVAASIYDIAFSEGVDIGLAFKLVKIESDFDPRARSSAGALGYTQIRPATAKFFEPGLTEAQLLDRDVNLRLGFRFLRTLIRQYDGNLELALVAYNRGPARVQEILDQGGNPANGYAEKVMRGSTRNPLTN
jgi:soluble lytic murein transglycosylase-like protein